MKVCVVIPAAGASTRFGADKLERDLGGRPMLVRTVEAFTKRSEVTQIIVAGPPDDIDLFTDRFGPTLGFHGAMIVPGGRIDRWETVANALASVDDEATHIAVHDAARPCVSAALLDRVFEAARTMVAVVPGVEVSSTLKEIDRASSSDVASENVLADAILGAESAAELTASPVLRTVPREGLVMAQTPQVFERSLLVRAYSEVDPSGATDDASVVERLGVQVHVVEGDPLNIKITVPADLALAQALQRSMSRSGG